MLASSSAQCLHANADSCFKFSTRTLCSSKQTTSKLLLHCQTCSIGLTPHCTAGMVVLDLRPPDTLSVNQLQMLFSIVFSHPR